MMKGNGWNDEIIKEIATTNDYLYHTLNLHIFSNLSNNLQLKVNLVIGYLLYFHRKHFF